jgi:ATP dependent DNA ligase domain
MLATLTEVFPTEGKWVYEPKLDGVRALIYVSGGEVRIYSRNRKLLNDAYPELVDALTSAVRGDAVLDGEIVTPPHRAPASGSVRCWSATTTAAFCAMPGKSAPATIAGRWKICTAVWSHSTGRPRPLPKAPPPRAISNGSIRGWSEKWASPNGPPRDRCGIPDFSVSDRTNPPARCGGKTDLASRVKALISPARLSVPSLQA